MMTGYDDAMMWARIATDPKAYADRLAALKAKEEAAAAREQAAVEAEASLAARIADLDKREATIRDQELEVHNAKRRNDAVQSELVIFASMLKEREQQLMRRELRAAGLLDGQLSIQALPHDWQALDQMLGRPADVHYDSDDQNMVVSPVEHASPQATITRSTRRSMRRISEL